MSRPFSWQPVGEVRQPLHDGASSVHKSSRLLDPYALAFRDLMAREGVLLEGPLGWGEFCAFVE